jgi:hypothetical protein
MDKTEKKVTIRVPEEVHARLQARADAEGTTVTAILTDAAMRDPRLEHGGAEATAAFLAKYGAAFAAAYPHQEPRDGTDAGRVA